MKGIVVFILVLSSLIFISGCNYSTNVNAQKAETVNQIVTTNTPINSSLEQDTNFSKSDSKLPRIWVGLISSDNGSINSSNVVWTAGDDTAPDIPESEGGIKIGTEYDVDIMNCGGYLGSGKIAFVEEGGFPPNWSLKFTSETIAADAVEKVEQCDGNPQDKFVDGEAFAIAPQNANRQNNKIGKVDTRKLFASLPGEIKKQLNNKLNAKTREKNNLSLTYNSLPGDKWTDIDGDGNIDLIELSINCGEYKCGLIMYLVDGKWIKIGEVQPA